MSLFDLFIDTQKDDREKEAYSEHAETMLLQYKEKLQGIAKNGYNMRDGLDLLVICDYMAGMHKCLTTLGFKTYPLNREYMFMICENNTLTIEEAR